MQRMKFRFSYQRSNAEYCLYSLILKKTVSKLFKIIFEKQIEFLKFTVDTPVVKKDNKPEIIFYCEPHWVAKKAFLSLKTGKVV